MLPIALTFAPVAIAYVIAAFVVAHQPYATI